MSLNELLTDVLDTEAEGEQELIKTLKASGVEDEAIEIAKANYRIQHGFKDKLSEDALATVAKAAGYWTKARDEDEDEDEDKKPPFLRGKKKTKDKKSHVPADMPPEMAAIFKSQQDELAEVKKSLDDERLQRVRKEYIEKCADQYAYVPSMNAEQMGEMLQKAYEVGEEFGKQLEAQWAATSEAVKKGSLMHASGRLVTNTGGGGAPVDKLNAIAKGIQTKKKITFAKAFTEAMTENNDLYEEYLADNPAQTGRRA